MTNGYVLFFESRSKAVVGEGADITVSAPPVRRSTATNARTRSGFIGPSLVIRRRTRGISRGRAAAGGCMPVLGAKSGAEIRHRCVPHVVLLALRPELQ